METLSLSQDLFPKPLGKGPDPEGTGPRDACTCLQIKSPSSQKQYCKGKKKNPFICLYFKVYNLRPPLLQGQGRAARLAGVLEEQVGSEDSQGQGLSDS